ncbi:MAG: hypothetical protein ABIT71_00880 [Vicinamibacteraceae bacterium]
MKVLVPLFIILLAAGTQLPFFREQFRSRADRLDQSTADAIERGWRFTSPHTRNQRHPIDRWEGFLVGLSGAWTAFDTSARHSSSAGEP